MAYGYIGSMKAKVGHRDELVSILLGSVAGLRDAGCHLYLVSVSDIDSDAIWVTEVWQTKQHHDASLLQPEARVAISKAMPLLTGEFTSQELSVVGGLGLVPRDAS
jgi:quinol monooxygenase YgiN